MKIKQKNIGIDAEAPKQTCVDKNCPFHGNIKIRGRLFEGEVISDSSQSTVTVEWPRYFYLRKYERYEKRRSDVKAHNPKCINARKGNKVLIAECRPLSKTKHFVVVKVLK